MKGITKIVCLLVLLCSIKVSAQSYLEFVENKGQWKSDIKYKGLMVNGAFALKPSGYKVVMHNGEEMKAVSEFYHGHNDKTGSSKTAMADKGSKIVLHSHAYEVKFLGANENATIVPEKPIATYNNYFLDNDPSKWASNCKIYQAITYKNIYPNIDVRYYTDNGHLKYDIIVNPGGDANKIAMYFDGVDGLKTKNGDLIIKTSIGDIKELTPYSYQLSKTTKKDVGCSYDVRGNIVRFKTEGILDKSATLVIDPTLIFSTFTGSTSDNWGYTATYDGAGNLYAGGIVFGPGFPVSNGAYQTTYQGGNNGTEGAFDIGIMKFNPTGTNRVYATYIGGSDGNEQPHSLVVDNAGNLIISGRTQSSNYPTTLPIVGTGGGWDIILTKLNAAGTALLASRKFGGSANDGVNIDPKYGGLQGSVTIRRYYGDDARSEVIIDNAGNICLASCTQSTDFPTTTGAAQTIPGIPATGRYQDGVVIKTNPDLSNVLFSTLIGGTGDDAAFVLAINPTDNNIYVAGGTTSTDMPGNFAGTIYPTNNGGLTDGFVQVLTSNGSAFVQSTYMGTSGIDIVYGIQFDKFSYPYVMGTTTGNWPVLNATFNQTGGKQFISKLKKDLSGFEYSTVFGTNSSSPNISPTAFLVDRCENVYVSGWGGQGNTSQGYTTSNTLGLTVTPDAYKPTTDGDDFYFIVLERNAASQLYGSFFGQNGGKYWEHVDGGTSRFDKSGIIYQSICANCEGGAVFPTTPGAWSEVNGTNGTRCNLAAIKIAFNLAGVGSGLQSSLDGITRDTSGCVPLEVFFRDTIAEGKKYIWRFGDGSPDVTTTVPNTSHIYNLVGNYNVMLVSIDSAKCNISDTSRIIMRVRNDDAPLAFDAIKQLPCNSLSYNFVNNSIFPPAKPFKANSFRWEFGDGVTLVSGSQTVNHSYAAPGIYNVRLILIDTNYCNEPDTAFKQLRVAPLVKAQFETSPSGCAPYTALFTNKSLAGTDFTWDFGDGSPTSTAVNPTHYYANVGTYIVKLIAIDTATCNKIDSAFFTITVSGKPTVSFTYSPQPPVANTYVVFTNNSAGGSNYKWFYGDGDSLVTTNVNALVRHLYNETKAFQACLITYNTFGCSDTLCKTIQAYVVPAIDVPNAFTPNNDGVNDVVYVNGFGVKNMTWRIYNRWGVLMYTSNSIKAGWDGKFNGVLQPQDVYNYGLEVEYTNGQKYAVTGDITLLR